MKKVVVVGAGVCGLSTAYRLLQNGCEVIIVEKLDSVGGLSQTYEIGGLEFDSGPHRFYTSNEQVIQFIKDVLDDDYLSMKMRSSVCLQNRYYDWPLKFKIILKLPIKTMLGAALDMIVLPFKRKKEIKTYQDYVLYKYGRTLYNIDFNPYTTKFAKIAISKIHPDWAKAGINRAVIDEKVKMNSLFDVVKNTLFPQKDNITMIYPRHGIQEFSDKLVGKIQALGGRLVLGTVPKKIEKKDGRIDSIILENGETIEGIDDVVWTGSINDLKSISEYEEGKLEFLNIVTYNLVVKGNPKMPYQWIYYADKDVIFNRVYNTVLFSEYMAPENYYGICIEVTCREDSKLLKDPAKLYEKVIEDTLKVKLVDRREDIEHIEFRLLSEAYPLLKVDYRDELEKAVEAIYNEYSNITLAGRSGLFWYNNMDHSIENAFETAENIIHDKRKGIFNTFWE